MPWLSALLALFLAAGSARAEEPLRVTTENAQYCGLLAERLAASPQPVSDTQRDLGEEGKRLCATGHVRTGIARLRRALRAGRTEPRGE